MLRHSVCLILLSGIALAKLPCQVEPAACLRGYYASIQDGAWDDAHSLLSPRAGGQLSASKFQVLWTNTIRVKPSKPVLRPLGANQVEARFAIDSLEVEAQTGARLRKTYQATALLKKVQGAWIIDSLAPKLITATPFKELEVSRFFTPVGGAPAQALPSDVPPYPGFTLSQPMCVTRVGEKGVVNLVTSRNRLPNVTPDQVVAFYTDKLTPLGWTTQGPAGGTSCQEINFKKAGILLNVHIYQGIVDGTDAPMKDPKGSKLDLVYTRS